MDINIYRLLSLCDVVINQEKDLKALNDQVYDQAESITSRLVSIENQYIRNHIEICHYEEKMAVMERKFLQYESFQCEGSMQYIWRIEHFKSRLQEITGGLFPFIESDKFINAKRLMCVRLHIAGGKPVFSVHLKKSHIDHLLRWPFVAKVALSVLDQSGVPLPYRQDITVGCEFTENDPASNQPQEETNPQGIGNRVLLPIEELIQAPYCTGDDVVMIKVQFL